MPRAGLSADAVLDAASALADAEGLEAVSLARLAADFGVRPPSLYKHVDGIGGVRRALAVRALRELTARAARAAVGRAGHDALIPVVDAVWDFARAHPGLYAASVPAPADDDPELQQAADDLLGVLLDVLAGYGLDGDDALHAVRALRAILHGFLSLDAAGGFGLPLDVEESFRRLVASFVRGLGDRPAAR